jgi:KUP system potassium uptake protein
LTVVLVFRHSSRLASAFGLAVSGTMLVTSVVYYFVCRARWSWPRLLALAVMAMFLLFDVPFFVANVLKLASGAWVSLLIALGFFAVMMVWGRGRLSLERTLASKGLAQLEALPALAERCLRVPGTGVFLALAGEDVPPLLLHYARRARALPDAILVLTVRFEHVPVIRGPRAIACERRTAGLYRIAVPYGFRERPNIPEILSELTTREGLTIDHERVTYFVGHETFMPIAERRRDRLQEAAFAWLARNTRPATAYLQIPLDDVLEVGIEIDLQ